MFASVCVLQLQDAYFGCVVVHCKALWTTWVYTAQVSFIIIIVISDSNRSVYLDALAKLKVIADGITLWNFSCALGL